MDDGGCAKSDTTKQMNFFFNDTATTEIYTLSLHDALPIWSRMHPTETDAVTAAPHATRICQRRIHYTSGPNHTYSQCTHRIHNPDLLARTYTTYHTHTPTSYCAHSYCTLCTYLARNSHTIHISHTHERIALVTYTWDATQAAMAPLLS